MDTTATSVAKVVAMQFTVRMTSATQTMIGLNTPTMTMRKATNMKMRPTLKIPFQQLLIAMWTRPRTSTRTRPTSRPLPTQIPRSRLKSTTLPTPPTRMPASASMRSTRLLRSQTVVVLHPHPLRCH